MKFLLIGKGNYFNNNKKPQNLTWINQYLHHNEMMFCINQCRYALMPTRRDTQGVMSCELVTYGIPLITSDMPVCREIFGHIKGVIYIDNDNTDIDLSSLCADLKPRKTRISFFEYEKTVCCEETIIKKVL